MLMWCIYRVYTSLYAPRWYIQGVYLSIYASWYTLGIYTTPCIPPYVHHPGYTILPTLVYTAALVLHSTYGVYSDEALGSTGRKPVGGRLP